MNLELSCGCMGVALNARMIQCHAVTWAYLIQEKEDGRMSQYHYHVRVHFVAMMTPSWLCSSSGFDRRKDTLSSQKGHQKRQRADHRRRRHSALRVIMRTYMTTRKRDILTNYMLDDHLDCTQRHVTAGNLVCSSCAPFVRRNRLQEMLDRREQFNWIQLAFAEILRNIPSQLPDTFQYQFSNLSLFRICQNTITGKWLDNLEKKRKQGPGICSSARRL